MKNKAFFDDFDKEYSYKKSDLGIKFLSNKISVKLWQPLAKKVEILIFDKSNFSTPVTSFLATKKSNVWSAFIPLKFEGLYYQYKIFHNKNKITFALDPMLFHLQLLTEKKMKIK